jgi:uncharacterized protein
MTDTAAPAAPHAMFDEDTATAGAVTPVAAADRIETLDFIRGIAVMGILAANIVAFGQPFDAYMYPAAFLTDPGDPGGWGWIAQFVLIDGKMRGLFTLLFGAGMYLFMEKAWARGGTRWLQAWRLLILLGFGMIHFFFIWPGDILTYYAIFGLMVLGAMGWSAKTQLRIGLLGYGLGVLFYAAMLTMPFVVADTPFGESTPELKAERAGLAEEVETLLAEAAPVNQAIAAGDYAAVVMHRITEEWWEPLANLPFFFLETVPLMLLGMALYRMGFFAGAWDRGRMLRWGWIGLIAGAAMHLAIALLVQLYGFSYWSTLAGFVAWTPLPRLGMILGLAALLVVYSPAATGWLGERVRAAGRAAFSNYLGTSILMLFVFHGWALGLFGQLNRPQLYLVVVLTCALMLAWSKPWLDRFNYGPLEWLWRCLTYRRVFALRR